MNRIVPLILAVALFMELMDSTIIATSLPAIAADINTDPIALKLAMTSYLVALAIFVPTSAWIGDRFGVRRVFCWSILVFILGSLACAMANSLPSFVAARFFQGMGGAMMTPLARLVLMRSTEKKDMVNAISWLTIPALMGPILGAPVGGFLTTYFSWHWIFLINVPIGALGIVMAIIFLPRIEAPSPGRLDWLGFILTGTAFSGVLFGVSIVSLPVLPPIVGIVTTSVGVLALIGYVLHARRKDNPLLNLDLFQYRIFRMTEISAIFLRFVLGSMPFLLPLMLQLSFGLTPFETGGIILFSASGALATKFFVSQVYTRFGYRHTMIASALVTSSSMFCFGFFNPQTPMWIIAFLVAISGVGRSVFFTGAAAISIAELPKNLTSHGTATSSVLRYIGLAFGVALAGGVLELLSLGRSAADITLTDFQIAFFVIGGLAMFAAVPFMFLPANSGAAISGHRLANPSGR